jgi:hypothetical protein
MKALGAFFVGWFRESFIALDQAVNAIVMPLFTWTVGMSDETLSARSYRMNRDGKFWGFLMYPIDLLFFWQGPNHCANAYRKERERANLPPEYR